MNREFLMLAHVYDPDKHDIAGWYASEKIDGQRCLWDGGISRGRSTYEVPWANTAKNVRPVATGLWTRLGNVINAPDWFLDLLPEGLFLDGELFSAGGLEATRSIISRHVPDERWEKVCYMLFDTPSPDEVFRAGRINGTHFKKIIDPALCAKMVGDCSRAYRPMQDAYRFLKDSMNQSVNLTVLPQRQLSSKSTAAKEQMYVMLGKVCDKGGEGLMLRRPLSVWHPKRNTSILKVKPFVDSEAVVVGHTAGKDALGGMLGALIVTWGDVTFELSGMNFAERVLLPEALEWARKHPGETYPRGYLVSSIFPQGTIITFRYTGSLTNGGRPKEARYWRRAS